MKEADEESLVTLTATAAVFTPSAKRRLHMLQRHIQLPMTDAVQLDLEADRDQRRLGWRTDSDTAERAPTPFRSRGRQSGPGDSRAVRRACRYARSSQGQDDSPCRAATTLSASYGYPTAGAYAKAVDVLDWSLAAYRWRGVIKDRTGSVHCFDADYLELYGYAVADTIAKAT
jgi:hypothetical protein